MRGPPTPQSWALLFKTHSSSGKPSVSQHLRWVGQPGRGCLRRPDHSPGQAPSFLLFTRQCLSGDQATAQHGGSEARSSLLPLSTEPGGLEGPGLLLGFRCAYLESRLAGSPQN